MSNKRDNSPSLDYFELRRRHEEFKNRERMANFGKGEAAPAEPQAARPKPAQTQPVAPQSVETPRPAETGDVPGDGVYEPETAYADVPDTEEFSQPSPMDIEDFSENYDYEPAEGDYSADDYDDGEHPDYVEDESYEDANGEEFEDNPNPFDSFIRVFNGLKARFDKRRRREPEEDALDEEDFGDDGYSEDAYPEDDAYGVDSDQPADDVEDVPEETSPRRGLFGHRKAETPVYEEDEPSPEAAAVVEDIVEDADDLHVPAAGDVPVDGDLDEDFGGLDFEDDDYSGDVDGKSSGELSGFKRFLRLFIVPVDEDEIAPEDDEDEEMEEDDLLFMEHPMPQAGGRHVAPAEPEDDDNIYMNKEDAQRAIHAVDDEIEGGLDMADQNKINPELTKQLAADLDHSGMTRRERRELAERLAAQKATEEKTSLNAAPESSNAVPDLFAEKPLEADRVEGVSDGIVSIANSRPDMDVASVDEPTREYKSLSKLNFDEFVNTVHAGDEDEDDEEDEDEDKPARKSLFGRRSHRDDDEDDEEDDEDDDEDEDEDVKPRRRLFGGRKSSKYDEDEDEDEDDEEDDEDEAPRFRRKPSRRSRYDDEEDEDDDYDDEDEYDEYDDEDEYDDDYDDEDDSSVGHKILGVFRVILYLIVIVLVLVLALNVLDLLNVVSMDNLAQRMPSGVVNVLLPSQNLKRLVGGVQGDATGDFDALGGSDNLSATDEPDISLPGSDASAGDGTEVTQTPEISATETPTQAPTATPVPNDQAGANSVG